MLERTHYERDVVPRWPGGGIPDDALPESLFQLELCIRCIMNAQLEPVVYFQPCGRRFLVWFMQLLVWSGTAPEAN